ncbi:Uncharacterised protein [Vibrio cholerae]|uniref:Uncharacterized protein n=1 Tax=Vibrio cholerae TaxID=666 RepID=A0A656AU43_VIBCL|nr:Uncharacterised protein [Vibrio cholerae]
MLIAPTTESGHRRNHRAEWNRVIQSLQCHHFILRRMLDVLNRGDVRDSKRDPMQQLNRH